jgi:Protein of unknown function (DUF4235)
MADNGGGGGGGRALGILADLGASYGARWVLAFCWKQMTGREPPTDPEDLHVGIGESLAWAVVIGVGTEIARILAIRAVARKMRQSAR